MDARLDDAQTVRQVLVTDGAGAKRDKLRAARWNQGPEALASQVSARFDAEDAATLERAVTAERVSRSAPRPRTTDPE